MNVLNVYVHISIDTSFQLGCETNAHLGSVLCSYGKAATFITE